ncbi:MAG: TIR domain-containing protein [Pseudonocardia sp.]
MARVFVSYANTDNGLACEVHRWLISASHEVFLAQDLRDGIAVGDRWRQRLLERLRWADAVVCVVTPAYLTSIWCTAEIATAQSRGSRLLPMRAGPEVTHPLLTDVQFTSMTADPDAARAALNEALRRVDAAGGAGWPDDRSPFPGLRPFDADQHRVFFGRTEEVKQLTELLRSAAETSALLVVGPSGSGKSSLVRAGLVPVLARESGWSTLSPIVPGADPVAALARELAAAARRVGLDWTVEHVHHRLGQRGLTSLTDELLLAAPTGPQQRLLIVADQFEELLTQSAPAERTRFAELLRPALTGPVQVVATLSPEFLDQLLLDPGLAALPTFTYTLRPLRRDALRAVIERPAQMAGITLDDTLTDRLVEDTDTGEALPLLAFTLAQLTDGIPRGGQLSTTRYDQLGGVRGALTHQANAALADAVAVGGRSREEVIGGLLRLVTVDEHDRPIRWRVNRDELPGPVVAELSVFVTRRLLSTDTENGAVVIGVAHEAFFSAWPPLADAIARNVTALRARRAVERAAGEWHDNDRHPARLWMGGQLAAAVTDTGARLRQNVPSEATAPQRRWSRWWLRWKVLVSERVELSLKARQFLHASIRRDRFRRRRDAAVLAVLFIALVAVSVTFYQLGIAQEQQRGATAGQLVAQADAIRVADPRTALQLGIAAQYIQPSDDTYVNLVTTLATTRYADTLTGHTSSVYTVAFTTDGRTLATAGFDGTVILWDRTDPTQPRRLGPPLTDHTGSVNAVAFSPDGRTLATAGVDGTVILWDLTDRTQPRPIGPPLTGHTGSVNAVAFSPDGKTLATAGFDGTVILWDRTDPTQPRRLESPLTGHAGSVLSVAFAPVGATLATAGVDGTVILWDLADPTQPRRLGPPLTRHTGSVLSVAFAPDSATLATASADNTMILWDLSDDLAQPRILVRPLTAHTDSVNSVAFAPDGASLATASADGTAVLWDVTDPAQPRRRDPPLTGHTGSVSSVAFAPDGALLATASTDNRVILWDVTDDRNQVRDHVVERACSITRGGLDPDEWARYIPGLPYQDTCHTT